MFMQIISAVLLTYLIVGVIIAHLTWFNIRRTYRTFKSDLDIAEKNKQKARIDFLNETYEEVRLLCENKNAYMLVLHIYALHWVKIILQEARYNDVNN